MAMIDDWPEYNADNVRNALNALERSLRELYGERAPAVMVYGSQARRAASSASDIDVLLIYPDEIRPGREIRRLRDILAEINLRYLELVSVLPVSEKDYAQRTTPFWVNVRKEGVSIDAI